MASDFITSCQKSLVATLRSVPDITALVDLRITDVARPDLELPFVHLDRFDGEPRDTDGTVGFTLTVGIAVRDRHNPASADVERRKPTTVRASRLAQFIIAHLHRHPENLTAEGFKVVDVQYLTSTSRLRGGDGEVEHRLAFEIKLDPQT